MDDFRGEEWAAMVFAALIVLALSANLMTAFLALWGQ